MRIELREEPKYLLLPFWHSCDLSASGIGFVHDKNDCVALWKQRSFGS